MEKPLEALNTNKIKKLGKKKPKNNGNTTNEAIIVEEVVPTPSTNTSTSSSSSRSSGDNIGCGGGFSYNGVPLQKGSCGREVYNLQKYLGIYQDGKFGNDTEKAVKGSQNLVSATPIGWTAGYGKVSEKDYKLAVK